MPSREKQSEIYKRAKALLEKSPDDVVRAVFDHPFWLRDLSPSDCYTRYEDDSPTGFIRVMFSDDSDAWIEVISDPDPDDNNLAMRFRTYFGGGQSLRVRNALLLLALAIKLDNEKHPQHRHPRKE